MSPAILAMESLLARKRMRRLWLKFGRREPRRRPPFPAEAQSDCEAATVHAKPLTARCETVVSVRGRRLGVGGCSPNPGPSREDLLAIGDRDNNAKAAASEGSKSDKRKQSLYFPEEMLEEIKEEAARLDRSLSWIVQRAWKIARVEIKRLPSVDDILEDEEQEQRA